MVVLAYTIINAVTIFLYVMMIAMFGRVMLGWFPALEDGPVALLVTKLTDMIVIPVRNVTSRFEYFDNLPFDISLFASMIVLMIVTMILGV